MIPRTDLCNYVFPWKETSYGGLNCKFKGSITFQGKILDDSEIAQLIFSYLSGASAEIGINKFLRELGGDFAMVIESSDKLILLVDRLRSIPLFYVLKGTDFLISDDPARLQARLNYKFDDLSIMEFLLSGYVTGRNTLVNGIYQLPAGEFVICDKKTGDVQSYVYHTFPVYDTKSVNKEPCLETLDKIFVEIFTQHVKTLNNQGKKIVVPLSGGIDSRVIVALLNKVGASDVICFSYGRKNNLETKISREVSESLGYEWHFIEYTREKWYDCYHSTDKTARDFYLSNMCSLPHLQDFLAVSELNGRSMIPEKSVFIPGHTGDMLSGGHIPRDYSSCKTFCLDDAINFIIKKHYNFFNLDTGKIYGLFSGRIKEVLKGIDVSDGASYAMATEVFDHKERQSKFIVNSVRAYEYLGYEWRIPLWDLRLMDYFSCLPIAERLNQKLYLSWALDKLFVGDMEILRDIPCTSIKRNRHLKDNIIGKYSTASSLILDRYFDVRWGRHFKNRLSDRILLHLKSPNLERFNDYPLSKSLFMTNDYLNSLGSFQSFEYIDNLLKSEMES